MKLAKIVAGVLAACAALGVVPAVAEAATAVPIMPLGDSITQGGSIGGYRLDLGSKLRADGRSIDFVGSLADGPSSMPDRNHEGHPGWTIAQIDANVSGWLSAYHPHTILLHIGTNDMYGSDPAGAPRRLSALVDRITNLAPGTELFVATIIPIRFADPAVRTFNAAIAPDIRAKAAAGKRVHLVDMYPSVAIADLPDGIHPDAAGYSKMATTWYNALKAVPGSIGGDSQPPAGGPCTATPRIVGTWNNGFQGEVTVANTGTEALDGWTAGFALPAGQSLGQIWGGTATGTGAVTVKNVAYNGVLAPGATTTFGFLVSGPGTASLDAATCTSP
ncbi:cellulose binding domain-containing protein [Amycolatopsis mediterranei]|uniref:SGNH hydrolase n=2 Tax=Amycolatopsis mediterranei TaxID=33910 RepID=A0A0H3D4G3_AMYMU|nr:cellulose binding domain-containing protein [Amycolatopsis mediterranei]ADJ45077.1 SGNH hydrolase [Amycolatopsis mediterranei U32]AGT83916.1 SGNH hydrolase [Amycolatopsis mediterranei RB]KDO08717.1 SGNH hydrolase [Amycolatopsis mediterranei]KDU87323.1 SGNH hydrolase [Amycolatopsis mediterranei]UZF70348.1 cellulose binding domain-containing protein [Amycolatopsis mediterranei]